MQSWWMRSAAKWFLSTPPSRVATRARRAHRQTRPVSIHATLAGGDPARWWTRSRQSVSIHATLAGGDRGRPHRRIWLYCFYPRHPRGWRPRGWTLCRFADRSFYPRHPRGWRRCGPLVVSVPVAGFYPRHPRGWRRKARTPAQPLSWVSIHATLAGGDCSSPECQRSSHDVSIHATLAGGDCWRDDLCIEHAMFLSTPPSRVATCNAQTQILCDMSFYPRHPRGWRLTEVLPENKCLRFLSTPPSRVATSATSRLHSLVMLFLSTPPSRVATLFCIVATKPWVGFLSTPPSRVATVVPCKMLSTHSEVSIHATLAGGDCGLDLPVGRYQVFLSTPPSRVATVQISICRNCRCVVSIHATLAGGDILSMVQSTTLLKFLSTPPSRVATLSACNHRSCSPFLSTPPSRVATPRGGRIGTPDFCFYPRHPRGWRPVVAVLRHDLALVSIHATLAGGDFGVDF